MGFIELEKTNNKSKNKNQAYSDTVYINDSLSTLNNVGSETYVFETKEERNVSDSLVSARMNGSKIQKEGSLISICLTTFISSAFMIILIISLFYLSLNISNSIEIFPHQSNYTDIEFNTYLKRSFIILFGIVSFLSIASMIVINNSVKARFRDYYLSKFKIFIYDIFVIIQNIVLYVFEMIVMFNIVNNIHNDFIIWEANGTIIGSVNIDTIEIFKYVIVIIMTIFIVLNSFSSIDIIHQKNKFVLEDQI